MNTEQVGQIATGLVNTLLNREEELSKERINICKDCRLWYVDSIFGATCNDSLYLNTKTDQVSRKEKPGFKNGCGCILRVKTRVVEAHCPLDK